MELEFLKEKNAKWNNGNKKLFLSYKNKACIFKNGDVDTGRIPEYFS